MNSIHDDLFPTNHNAAQSELQYDGRSSKMNSSRRHSTLTSLNSKDQAAMNASWKMKILVLLCMLSLPVGCHYLEATLGTLKTTLKSEMNINNTQFSILLSSVTLVNTFLPLLAGVFIDDISSLGPIRATTIVSFVIFFGSLLVSIGATKNSYPCMMTGQIFYGLGGGMIVTMQEGILSRWFRDKELAIIIGIVLCVARLTKWAAKMVAYPILNSTGSHAWPIHVATIFCAGGALINSIYWIVMWKKGLATKTGKEINQYRGTYKNEFKQEHQAKEKLESNTPVPDISSIMSSFQQQSRSFKWSYSVLFYLPKTFWMIPLIQLTMSSVLSSFDDVATEYVEFRYNTSSVMAGYQSSLTQVVPIVMAPIMGIVVHKYGKRITILFFATLILMTSMILLAYTWVTPAIGMIIFSFALALGPVSVLSSTSLLLPHELAGTGMGLHKCFNNIGTTIVSVLVGYVQDLTFHDGDPHDDITDLQTEYNGVMILYLSMATFSTLVVALFWFMDRVSLSGWLQADKQERQRRLQEVQNKEEDEKTLYMHAENEQLEKITQEKLAALSMIGSKLTDKKSYVYVSISAFWLFVSWIVFFTFALMPVYQSYI
ncbi:major facilitator superfamily domain-containing protein [Thamnidium elegans]|nr:major facilitator superfamily domain-containing protein [Thamnidium elegans]